MLGRALGALALLVLAPAASAERSEPVAGALELSPSASWAGEWRLVARDEGALNISAGRDAARPILLHAARFAGNHVEVERAGTAAALGFYHTFPAKNTSVEGAGEIRILCDAGCEALLFAHPGGELSLAGRSAGPLAPQDVPPYYTAYAGKPGFPNDFYYAPRADDVAYGGRAFADATARATGALGLFVSNATVEATLADGSRATWQLGREREDAAATPLAPGVTRIRDRFVVLHLDEAVFVAEDTDALLHARLAEATFAGELVAADARGTLRVDGDARELDGEHLILRGELAFADLARVEQAGILSEGAEGLRAEFTGSATRVRIATEEAVTAPPVAESAAGASLVLLSLAALARLLWLPLYSRLDRARVMKNPTRARILELVAASPGLTAPALARELGIARAVAVHHLTMLEAHRCVTRRRVRWASYYYLPETAPEAGAAENAVLLADDTRRRIAAEVARGVATQAELVAATGVSQRLVSYHLARLEEAGLVEVVEGRPRRFTPTPPLLTSLLAEPARAATG